jgi:hypothetical protein
MAPGTVLPERSLAIATEDINAKERERLAIVFFIRVSRLLHSSIGNSDDTLHGSILTQRGQNDGTTRLLGPRALTRAALQYVAKG